MSPPAVNERRAAAAMAAVKSYDAEARTVEAILSSGAAVRRGFYVEELEISAKAVDLTRVAGGQCCLLNVHNQGSLDAVLGTVRNVRIEGGALVGTLAFGETDQARHAEGLVARGELRGVSIGYAVRAWHPAEIDSATRVETWRAAEWELLEVSLVPVPADAAAGVRSAHPASGSQTQEADMTHSATAAAPTVDPAPTTSAAGAGDRSSPPPGFDAVSFVDQARSFGVEQRARELAEQCRLGRISEDAARSALLTAAADAQRARTSPAPVGASGAAVTGHGPLAEPQTRAQAMGEALYARAHPRHELSAVARSFSNMGTLDLAREALTHAGQRASNLAPDQLIRAALTTSDFPLALGNFVHRELRDGYALIEGGLRSIARETTARDFRAKSRINVETTGKLERVLEDGEVKHGGAIESGESYAVETFGKIVSLTRQALVNDDLDIPSRLARQLGQDAAVHETKIMVALLEANSGAGPKMSDGKALFHADHGNLVPSTKGGSPNPDLGEPIPTRLSATRLLMRRQKRLNGDVLGIAPKFLIVPSELETQGEALVAELTPGTVEAVNSFAGRLQLVVEPRLTSPTRWYVAADPVLIDGLEFSYLEGARGPQIETEVGFEVLGINTRVILDFGAGFVDWRSWAMNPGA